MILERVAEDRGMMNRFYGTPTATMAEKLPTLQTHGSRDDHQGHHGDSIDLFDQFVSGLVPDRRATRSSAEWIQCLVLR